MKITPQTWSNIKKKKIMIPAKFSMKTMATEILCINSKKSTPAINKKMKMNKNLKKNLCILTKNLKTRKE